MTNPPIPSDQVVRLPVRRRLAPVVALMALAPWAAECSWGGFPVSDYPLVVAVLAPLYGGAAVLVRETARRTGGGWPAIVALAGAFGVLQAGLIDQSLFNPGFLDDTEFAEFGHDARTWIPGLEVSAQQAFGYVGNHIALSICAPIVIVESFLDPHRRSRAWLRRPGLLVVGLLFVLGALLIFSDDQGRKGHVPSAVQVVSAAATVAALIAAGVLSRRRRPRPGPGTGPDTDVGAGAGAEPGTGAGPGPGPDPGTGAPPAAAPRPVWVAVVVLVAYLSIDLMPGWAWLAAQTALVAGAVALIVRWSRRAGWGQRHALAAWSTCLATVAVTAYLVPSYRPVPATEALLSDITGSVLTVALVGGAFWRLSRRGAGTGL